MEIEEKGLGTLPVVPCPLCHKGGKLVDNAPAYCWLCGATRFVYRFVWERWILDGSRKVEDP